MLLAVQTQFPILALSNKFWANRFTSLSLIPREVKNFYQLFKWRFRDMSNDRRRRRTTPWSLSRTLRLETEHIFVLNINILQ